MLIKVEILMWFILSIIGLRAVFIVEGIITRHVIALMFMLFCFNVLIFTVRGFNVVNIFYGLISGICITGTLAIIPYLGHPESIYYIPYWLYALWIVSFLTVTVEGIVKILAKKGDAT